jgi:hypothetical protein
VVADGLSGRLEAKVIARFGRLGTILQKFASVSDEDAASDVGAQLFESDASQEIGQLQQAPSEDDAPITAPSPELRRAIARSSREDRAQILTPEFEEYIRKVVIQPAFDTANNKLIEDFQSIDDKAGEAKAAIAAAKPKATPEIGKVLNDLETSVDSLSKEVKDYRFALPQSDEWWHTIMGKSESIQSMMAGLAGGIESTFKTMGALAEIQKQAEAALKVQQDSAAALAGQLASLQGDADRLQGQIGDIGGPLKILAFKLDWLGPLLPIIIAIFIAAGALWSTYAIGRMTLALGLPKAGEQIDNMRAWLKSSVGGSRSRLMAWQAMFLVLAVTWVAFAISITYTLEPVFLTNGQMGALAIAVVIAARGVLWFKSYAAIISAEGVQPNPGAGGFVM